MEQNYQNHARYYPPFHYVLAPIILLHLVWSAKLAWDNPTWPTIEGLILATGLFVLSFVARIGALKAQDRVIRLEERLRYQEVLSPEMQAKAKGLRMGQIVALRFASDAELPALIEKILAGQLEKSKDIKLAIQSWRPDLDRV